MTEAISAGAIGAYGGLLLLTAWRCVVHWRASPFSRKALFHCLVAGFSATRLGAAVIDALAACLGMAGMGARPATPPARK